MMARLPPAYCLLLASGVWRLASGVSFPSDQPILAEDVTNTSCQL